MRNLRTNNPKEYWKILNSGRHKKQPNISIEDLLQFKNFLNGAPLNFDEIDIPSLNDDMMNGHNYNLYLYIQKDEIIKCIQKLKNNKAGGEDAIINEYIKTTSNQFIEIYEKLFNLIFDTGFIPESWVVGNIIPIYKNKGDSNDPKNFTPITLVSCLGKLFYGSFE